jgi:ATP-dependent Clp protease ATP-binding subunit ClpC
VFERYTERARQAVIYAQDEARSLNHNYIGTEHLLLGLLREQNGLAARVLESLDVNLEDVRARIVGQKAEIVSRMIEFTPRSKEVLELALREAVLIGFNYVGTEHILLGLIRENQGQATRILLTFNADAETIRARVHEMMHRLPTSPPPT